MGARSDSRWRIPDVLVRTAAIGLAGSALLVATGASCLRGGTSETSPWIELTRACGHSDLAVRTRFGTLQLAWSI